MLRWIFLNHCVREGKFHGTKTVRDGQRFSMSIYRKFATGAVMYLMMTKIMYYGLAAKECLR